MPPSHLQLKFANSDDLPLRSCLATNPNLSDEASARLIEQGFTPVVRDESVGKTRAEVKPKPRSTVSTAPREKVLGLASASALAGTILRGETKHQSGFLPSWFKGNKS